MDQFHATLHKASRSVHLDPHVRDGFRRTLEALVETPAIAEAGFRFPRALAWALAAVVAATTGATATYASTRAVPGDALYAMKINIVEPAEAALAFSAEAKAEVAVAHLERRFQEAAALSEEELATHDETLAVLAQNDIALVDRDDQPEARARFEALAAAYGPSLKLRNAATSRFAVAVRLGSREDVSADVAAAAAKEQLAIAAQKRVAVGDTASAAVSARLKTADRLSKAASKELDKGSYQAALELSGAAAQAASEAELFAALAAPQTTSTATTTTSTPRKKLRVERPTPQDNTTAPPAAQIIKKLLD